MLAAIQIVEDSSHEQSHEQSRELSHDPSRSSAERTAPPRSAHVQLDDDLRLLDPVEGAKRKKSFPAARRHDDDGGGAIPAGLRLSTADLEVRFGLG